MTRFLLRLLSRFCSLLGLTLIRINARKIRTGQFCDYCTCSDCRDGVDYTSSHLCADGSRICGTCRSDEPCYDVLPPDGHGWSEFCKDHPNCRHKPKLAEGAK